jgi:cilia- and flagella-associated protein 53
MFGQPNRALLRATHTHQGRFEKKRAQERQLESSIANINQNKNVLQYAAWENKTYDALSARHGRDRLAQMSESDKAALQVRRQQLAQQRAEEMAGWEQEVLSNVETIEERKNRIREKATKLRDAREASRRKFVTDMLDQQWRDSCDDARTLDSKATLEWVASQRWEQVAQKEAREAAEAAEEAKYTAKIHERMRYLEAQEIARDEKRARMAERMKDDLNVQVDYNAARRMAMEEQVAAEDAAELAELRAVIAADEAKERARREEAHARGAQVREFNASRQHLRAEAAEAERQRDLTLLRYAMAKDKAGEAEEQRKRAAEAEATRQYTQYLHEQMVKEAEDAGRHDAVRLAAENRVWDARDAEYKARADARARLQAAVHAGRQEQIALRDQREAAERAYFAEQSQFDRAAFAAAEEEELQKDRQRRQQLLDQAAQLREQVDERAAARAREAQDEYIQVRTRCSNSLTITIIVYRVLSIVLPLRLLSQSTEQCNVVLTWYVVLQSIQCAV